LPYLSRFQPVEVRHAVLAGMAYLRDPAFAEYIDSYIDSSDPQESYLATIALTRSLPTLDASDALIKVLKSKDSKFALDQSVILSAISKGLDPGVGAKSLFKLIHPFLQSESVLHQYWCLTLLDRCPLSLVEGDLIYFATTGSHNVLKEAATASLNRLLKGDMSIVARWITDELSWSSHQKHLHLMLSLDWHADSLDSVIGSILKLLPETPTDFQYLVTSPIAEKLFETDPQVMKKHLDQFKKLPSLYDALCHVWLDHIYDLDHEDSRNEWLFLCQKGPDTLVPMLCNKAKSHHAIWLTGPLIDRLQHLTNDTIKQSIRSTVKDLMELVI
jgi:hypothetical protein